MAGNGESSGKLGQLAPSLCTGFLGLSCPPGLSSREAGLFTWQLSASKIMSSKREDTEAFRPQCLDSKPKDITSSILYGKIVPGPAQIQGVESKEKPRQPWQPLPWPRELLSLSNPRSVSGARNIVTKYISDH